jgi:hypothetical protein
MGASSGALEALLGYFTVLEISGAQADATDRQALEPQRIESLADDHLGRSAADVDDQPLVRIHGAGVRNAGINQTRFFQPGNDFDGVPESGPRSFQEPALALGAPQRVGADHPYAIRTHRAQPLAESLEAAQRPLGGRIIQAPGVAHAGREAHHFAQPVQYDELVVRIPRHNHVKAV